MQTSAELERSRRRSRKAVALLLALGLVWVGALPAAADNESSGVAAGAGTETAFDHADPADHPDCLPVDYARYDIDVFGTFSARDGNDTASYTGPATVTVEASDFFITPDGTHASPACDNGPEPVEATVTVTSPNGNIACGPHAGTLLRQNFAEFQADWTGACTITVGSMSVSTPASTVHTFVGDQQPCPPDPFELLPPTTCDNVPLVHGVWTYMGSD